MKRMPIETQKKLMYIPVLNVINFFALVFNLNCAKVLFADLIKSQFYIWGYTIPVWFVLSLAARLLPSLEIVFYFFILYFCPLAMSFGSIKFQEKYL